jgi:hypothetical protein
MANGLCHFEFMSPNPGRSREFYSKIFSWKFNQAPEMGGYTMIETGAQPGGGMMEKPKEAPHPALNVYFMVDDVDAALTKVRGAGGKVINEKTPIPDMGSWAMFLDPDGICVGIFEPMKK